MNSLVDYDALQLFYARAQLVLPEFENSAPNRLAVGTIVRLLEGMPLAIELAAARVKALDVGQINKRLDDRFHLLTGGSRTALPRHQTLPGRASGPG